jgi:hypothetical protein
MIQIKHLVYGASAAGSLKCCLEDKNLQDQKVISICDDLSYGPLNDRDKRLEFVLKLADSISPRDKEFKEHLSSNINSWSIGDNFKDCKIVFWHSKNTQEQLMLQMVVNSLQKLDLYEISLCFFSTGTCPPEELSSFIGTETKISNERKRRLVKNWNNISILKGVLRVWQNDSIATVDEAYYDNELLDRCSKCYVNAARIVGDVLGSSEQLISDDWLNYRVVQLIKNDKLLFRGDLGQSRMFEVRLP